MTDRIELAKPDVGAREEELVLEVLRSGRLSLGPVQERFEQAVAAFLGVEDAVAVSSGTAALSGALLAADLSAARVTARGDLRWSA